MGMSAKVGVMLCIEFKLSHKPDVTGLNCGGWQHNKGNFTLLLFCYYLPSKSFEGHDSDLM